MDKNAIEKKVLEYAVLLYNVYKHLADSKRETNISKRLLENIIELGKSSYKIDDKIINYNQAVANINQIKFLLEFADAIGFTSDMNNYGLMNTNEIIYRGELLCLDLEKMRH